MVEAIGEKMVDKYRPITWKEFKEHLEAHGAKDSDLMSYVDIEAPYIDTESGEIMLTVGHEEMHGQTYLLIG